VRRLGWLSFQPTLPSAREATCGPADTSSLLTDSDSMAEFTPTPMMKDTPVAERAGGAGGGHHSFGGVGGRGRGAGKRRRGIPKGFFGGALHACPPGQRWSPKKSRCVPEDPDFRGLDRAMMAGRRGGETR
jgi:hypothetical protein